MLAALVESFEIYSRGDYCLNACQLVVSGCLVVDILFTATHSDCPCLLLGVVPTLQVAVVNAHGQSTLLLKSHGGRRTSI